MPVADRPWFQRVFDDGIDGYERLRRYASAVRRIYSGAGTAFEIVRRGADSDAIDPDESWLANAFCEQLLASRLG